MIPSLTNAEQLTMTLSQIRRYEKKYTKLQKNNKYYIQYYGYDVDLDDWSLHVEDGFIYAKGYLGNDNSWETSNIKELVNMGKYYHCTTESGTIYRLYFEDKYVQ